MREPVDSSPPFPETLHAYLRSLPTSGRHLYVVLLATWLAACASLPLVHVPIGVRARGIVRPSIEKHRLVAVQGGIVSAVPALRGGRVEAGDAVLRLASHQDSARLDAIRGDRLLVQGTIRDLTTLLLASHRADPGDLTTDRYRVELSQLSQEVRMAAIRVDQLRGSADRTSWLAAKQLVPASEEIRQRAELGAAQVEAELLVQRSIARWELDIAAARAELKRLALEELQARAAMERATVTAPVGGTLEELVSVSVGSALPAGAEVGVISPESALLAEVWVAATDVAAIREGVSARIDIDAFPYRAWGFVSGRVVGVASDYTLVGDLPFFRVTVALEPASATERTITRGLRKGMTLTAHFRLARRSLWDLLFSRFDTLLRPLSSASLDVGGV